MVLNHLYIPRDMNFNDIETQSLFRNCLDIRQKYLDYLDFEYFLITLFNDSISFFLISLIRLAQIYDIDTVL